MTLGASHPTYGQGEKTSLFLTIRNATPRPRRLAGFRVPQGNARYKNNDLLRVRDLSWVLRFPDGQAVAVRHVYPYSMPAMVGADGMDMRYGPLELPAGSSLREEFGLGACVFQDSRDAQEAQRRCRSFCVTAVVDGLGLKSNTLFFNGQFPLPAVYDPIAEAIGYRNGRGAEKEREYQQGMEDLKRAGVQGIDGPP